MNKPPFTLSEDDRQIIEQLAQLQAEMGLSNEDFGRRQLSYSGSVWSRIKAALKEDKEGYFELIEKPESVLVKLRTSLRLLRRKRAQRGGSKDFRRFDDFDAVLKACNEAKQQDDCDRIVFFLAPTGGGKSKLCQHLASQDDVYICEARKSWRASYYTALCDISAALNIDRVSAKLYSPAALEDAIRDQSSKLGQGLLVIDEGRFFGPDTLDFLIWATNNTDLAILICAPPEYYGRWVKQYPDEARQVVRRTHAVVRAQEINTNEAQEMLKDCGLNGDLKEAAILARDRANTFGRFDFLKRLAKRLTAMRSPKLEDVEPAMTAILAEMRAQELTPSKS